jgi:hypothetical protein
MHQKARHICHTIEERTFSSCFCWTKSILAALAGVATASQNNMHATMLLKTSREGRKGFLIISAKHVMYVSQLVTHLSQKYLCSFSQRSCLSRSPCSLGCRRPPRKKFAGTPAKKESATANKKKGQRTHPVLWCRHWVGPLWVSLVVVVFVVFELGRVFCEDHLHYELPSLAK